MYDVEYGLPESHWHKWSRRAVANVHDEGALANVNGLKIEAASGVGSEALEIWIQRLLNSNGIPINAKVSDGIDNMLEVR